MFSSLLKRPVARPMSTVGGASSSAVTYRYINLYLYIMLCYIYTVHIICYVCISLKKTPLSGSQNQHFNSTMRCITLCKTCCIYRLHFLGASLLSQQYAWWMISSCASFPNCSAKCWTLALVCRRTVMTVASGSTADGRVPQ